MSLDKRAGQLSGAPEQAPWRGAGREGSAECAGAEGATPRLSGQPQARGLREGAEPSSRCRSSTPVPWLFCMADAALVLGPGLELGAALATPGRLTVVADTLDVDGSWLLARMTAGALAREAGLAALLVFSEPGRREQWAQALRKAVRRMPSCCVRRANSLDPRRAGVCASSLWPGSDSRCGLVHSRGGVFFTMLPPPSAGPVRGSDGAASRRRGDSRGRASGGRSEPTSG